MSTVYRNRTAVAAWVFAALVMLLVVALTGVFLRDGPPPGHDRLLVSALMALLWLFGLGLLAYVASLPVLTVTLGPDARLRVCRRYPWRRQVRVLAATEVGPARVRESRDDDGDPYFHAQVELADGSRLDLREGHDRERCEAVCADFNRALARPAA